MRGLERLLGLDHSQDTIDLGELFTSWRLLFERLATRAGVVLLFEDLHWADQGLFDFIAHLCEWATRSRLLVLAFSRPDDRLETLTDLGTRIELQPLSDVEIDQLVAGAVERAPASLLRSVREHAAGVPLFAVESMRMLVDRGVMTVEDDSHRYRLTGEVDDLEVPPSIHALIAARLDRLGLLERGVLRCGAILGQRFTTAAAAALVGVTTADARSLLDGLVAKQFLVVDSEPRSQSRETFGFVHRQVQRVVLSTLSRRERKARHLAAAAYLSSQALDPDLRAILAGHLVAAYEAQPTAPDAPDIRARALRLTLDAAERAEGVGALNEAVALFDQAARIESDERQSAEHLVRAARCAERYGNQETLAAEHYASARELHERAGRTREALRLRSRELCVYRWSRPPAELVAPLQEVYDALRSERDVAFADAATSLARILYGDGAAEPAEAIAAEAAEAAKSAGAHEELGLALSCRASALVELARPTDALPLFQAALEIWERHAPSEVPGSLGNIAISFAALGRFEEAVVAGRRAIAAAERVASRVHRNLAALQLARALFSLGSWDEAVAVVDDAAPETAPANRGMIIGPPLLVAIHRGQLRRARAVIDEFDREEAKSGAAFESDYRTLRNVALAHLDGDSERAAATVARADSGDYAEWPTWLPLAIDLISKAQQDEPLHQTAAALALDAVPKSSPIIVAQIARLRALLAARAGRAERAISHWIAAIDAVRTAGIVFDEASLGLELCEHYPDYASVSATLQTAETTFAALRAAPWLDRIGRVRKSSKEPAA
jgi:tetratricopeptide (TPR) repeat protein